ncbi:hypothetical protein BH09BAC1_BH09BAC1_27480 [soil metagenome]
MPELLQQCTSVDAIRSKELRYERLNMVLVYLNSMLFSALFTFESIPVFLVKAVFNGSGIIMMLGLLSLIIGNITAGFRFCNQRFPLLGSYYSSLILFGMQLIFMAGILIGLVLKQ